MPVRLCVTRGLLRVIVSLLMQKLSYLYCFSEVESTPISKRHSLWICDAFNIVKDPPGYGYTAWLSQAPISRFSTVSDYGPSGTRLCPVGTGNPRGNCRWQCGVLSWLLQAPECCFQTGWHPAWCTESRPIPGWLSCASFTGVAWSLHVARNSYEILHITVSEHVWWVRWPWFFCKCHLGCDVTCYRLFNLLFPPCFSVISI